MRLAKGPLILLILRVEAVACAYRNSLKHAVCQPWKQHQNKVAKRVSFFEVWDTPVPDVATVLVDVVVLLLLLTYLSINILPFANRL